MPTPFTKQNLIKSGGFVTFITETGDRKFVARFKYAATSSTGPFMTFLRKNFTAEEFFARIDAGETPLDIAKSKGFILSHIKTWLRRDGYPTTPQGYANWQKAQVAKIQAR